MRLRCDLTINEALARWSMGDIGSDAALEAVCAVLEPCEASCALVRNDGTPDGMPSQGPPEALALARIARLGGDHRRLLTPRDREWHSVFAGLAQLPEAAWAACELVSVPGAGSAAAIVVIGWSDVHQHDVLGVLPLLARASATIVSRQEAARTVGRVQHALNNLLASVVANVEYAADLIEEPEAGPPLRARPTPQDRAEAARAMQNARRAAKEMGACVALLSDLARGST